jgi:hypothetical protein
MGERLQSSEGPRRRGPLTTRTEFASDGVPPMDGEEAHVVQVPEGVGG